MYYIDFNKNKFSNLNEYYNNNSIGVMDNKKLLQSKRLLVLKDRKVVYSTTNIQSLYLYPLNVLDYVKYAFMRKTLMYNILDIKDIDYKQIVNTDIKNVEILINNATVKEIKKILKLSNEMKANNKFVSYNIKTFKFNKEIFLQICKFGDYFKIKLNNILGTDSYDAFLKNIKALKNNSSESSLIHIKGYLNVEQVKYYDNLIKDLNGLVDIIQISKELMPINVKENPKIDNETQEYIRKLEKNNELFISVKDISTLYYPRFELDKRNSHQCYVWYLKPYIKGNNILPCKVNKVINNIDEWKVNDILGKKNKNNIKKYGKECKDCASIFENDILSEIFDFYAKGYDLLLEIDENDIFN